MNQARNAELSGTKNEAVKYVNDVGEERKKISHASLYRDKLAFKHHCDKQGYHSSNQQKNIQRLIGAILVAGFHPLNVQHEILRFVFAVSPSWSDLRRLSPHHMELLCRVSQSTYDSLSEKLFARNKQFIGVTFSFPEHQNGKVIEH